MTDTPTPAPESLRSDVARQLEEVLSLHARMVEVRRSGEEATAIHYQREFLCYAAEYVASHADTLRRALAALEAVEGAEDCMCSDCNGDGVWHLEPCGFCDGHGNFKMVPAPKTADAVEVK